MEAGGMIAHARSSQIRNAENRSLIPLRTTYCPIRRMFVDSNVHITVVFIRYDSDLC